MAKNVAISLIILSFTCFMTSADAQKKNEDKSATPLVEITTNHGVIKVKLYDETPLHRDNFLKHARSGFYDSTLFHRVINAFMIQGGDPESKNAPAGKMLGNGDVGYTVPAEFNDALYHKKGALCAARTENPEKASSGCQFYIVQGKPFTDAELTQMEDRITMQRKQAAMGKIMNDPANAPLRARMMELKTANHPDSLNLFYKTNIDPLLEKAARPFKYTDEQRNFYKTTGGTPHLDQGYTVYGEVVEGIEVLDKIASSKTAPGDRPLEDVRMTVKVLEKK